VERMRQMFMGATAFNQDIGNWNVSKVYGMNGMFTDAVSFDQDLGAWDISSVTASGSPGSGPDMTTMFEGASLSTANYDALLIGWSTDTSGTPGDGDDDIPTGITFHGGNSQYCGGETSRDTLTGTHGWTIADGGQLCAGYGTVWTGAVSNDWFNSGNWNNGVPGTSMKVFIPFVSPNPLPLINSAGAVANTLDLLNGATLTIGASGDLTIDQP